MDRKTRRTRTFIGLMVLRRLQPLYTPKSEVTPCTPITRWPYSHSQPQPRA